MDVPVPPAFVAVDKKQQVSGALIEWFYDEKDSRFEAYLDGGELMKRSIPQFDNRTGSQHNFRTLARMLRAIFSFKKFELAHDWISHWVDNFLEADVPWTEILPTMTAWLDQRRSRDALRLVVAAIQHRGTRKDLGALRTFEEMLEAAAREIIADAQFVVGRRSVR